MSKCICLGVCVWGGHIYIYIYRYDLDHRIWCNTTFHGKLSIFRKKTVKNVY